MATRIQTGVCFVMSSRYPTRRDMSVTATVINVMKQSTAVIPKLWPAASYKMVRQDLWSRIFYLHHISA